MATIGVDQATINRLKDIQYHIRLRDKRNIRLKDLAAEIIEAYYQERIMQRKVKR